MIVPTLLALHGGTGDDPMDLVYFWSAVLIAIVPVGAFLWIGWLVVRGYYKRRIPDGGGDPAVKPPSP